MIWALTVFAWAGDEDVDDLDPDVSVNRHDDGPRPVPYRTVGLTVAGGGVMAETPFSGDLAVTVGIRPKDGLRLDAEVAAWFGTAYLPGTNRVIPVAVPMVGAAVVWEAPTTGAARPWIGAGADVAMAMSDPVAAAPIGTARAGLDVGRSFLAWTVSAYGGVMVCPALPVFAGPGYRAVAPVFGFRTGPSVRL